MVEYRSAGKNADPDLIMQLKHDFDEIKSPAVNATVLSDFVRNSFAEKPKKKVPWDLIMAAVGLVIQAFTWAQFRL